MGEWKTLEEKKKISIERKKNRKQKQRKKEIGK